MSHGDLVAVVAFLMAIGLTGTVLPVVPGLVLVWLAGLLYGLGDGFGTVGVVALVVMGALAVAGVVVGTVLPHRRAGAAGAGGSSLALAAVLGVIGFFVVPVVGAPLGAVVGIYAGEQLRTHDRHLAWRATRATLAGFGLGALVQLAAGMLMILVWVMWVVQR